jgi:nucleolar MIF4G domain-containing protein 1
VKSLLEILESHKTETSVIKNVINCLVHFFLFKSLTPKLIFDVIKRLFDNFEEQDLELLLFILHNIGLQLRKDDPASIKAIIDLAT